jgi:putative tryptophan/tyrosine transport system substrate-binding protein
MTTSMQRRELITLLGGAVTAWPAAARAQQPRVPVIGYLHPESASENSVQSRAFRQGLKDVGYVEGDNVTIEHRSADNQLDRLPGLAADLERRRVAVIVAISPAAAFAAKAATTTVPIVFVVAGDPVSLGLVSNLARPNGNLTGINMFAYELATKRLDLLHQLVPGAVRIALLIHPAQAAIAESTLRDVRTAGASMGLQVRVLTANTIQEIDAAFATMARERPDALFVSSSPFFGTPRRVQLAQLAARHAIPATYSNRESAEIGGLMSYGTNAAATYRQVGVYTGRILKGTKPAELPVVQSTHFEFVINASTARMIGLTIPPMLLALADEVIE